MAELEESGEHPVRKRCPVCGNGPITMTWRPLVVDGEPIESSDVGTAGWWPMTPVREARMSCPWCKNLAYGRLVDGRVCDNGFVHGHFVVIPIRELVAW